MTVLGIAGPGDALANPKKTFDTMRQLTEKAPDIKLWSTWPCRKWSTRSASTTSTT
jgi:hypothetical protein